MNALLLAIALTTAAPSAPSGLQVMSCWPVGNILSATGLTVVDDQPSKSKLFDRSIIIVDNGDEYMWFFKDGCAVAKPLYLGTEPAGV